MAMWAEFEDKKLLVFFFIKLKKEKSNSAWLKITYIFFTHLRIDVHTSNKHTISQLAKSINA